MKMTAVFLTNSKTKELFDMTQNAIDSLVNSSMVGINLSVVVMESCQHESGRYRNVAKTIKPKEKFNFNRFLNIALRQYPAEWFLLCNNDIEFEQDWFLEMHKKMVKYPEILSLSPICRSSKTQTAIAINHQGDDIVYGYAPRKELSGWCILVNNKIFTEAGYLDEQFDFYFADNDYGMTLRKHCFKHALVLNSFVTHLEHKKTSNTISLSAATHRQAKEDIKSNLLRPSWVNDNAKMVEGFNVFTSKWGNWWWLKLKCLVFDFCFLRCNLAWISRRFF